MDISKTQKCLSSKNVSLIFLLGIIFLFTLPIISLVYTGTTIPKEQTDNWTFVLRDLLPQLISNTLFLIIGTTLVSSFIAVIAAFSLQSINSKYRFIFEVLLTAPIVFPIYIYAFIYIGMFEWASELSITLREMGIFSLLNIEFFNFKNIYGAIIIFSLALYPYIFIPLRLALRGVWKDFYYTAKILGRSNFMIYIDMLKAYGYKGIKIGAVVVALECLSEFGAVSAIGIDTFTTAIYTSVTSFYSIDIAARVGLVLLTLAISLLWIESLFRGKDTIPIISSSVPEMKISNFAKLVSYSLLFIILSFSLIIPSIQLVIWAKAAIVDIDSLYLSDLIYYSFALGAIVSVIVIVLSLALQIIIRFSSLKGTLVHRKLFPFTLLGYGIPGNLVAVCMLGVGVFLSPEGVGETMALVLLFAGLSFRFFRTSYRQIELGDDRVTQEMQISALILSNNNLKQFITRIILPILRPYILYSILFIIIEVVKEMPLTLMLRPMGVSTLATKLFELTSEGEWEKSALVTIPIIGCCLVLQLVMVYINRKNEKYD